MEQTSTGQAACGTAAASPCPACAGQGRVMRVQPGNGIISARCETCLGDRLRRRLPAHGQRVMLMGQGIHDFMLEGFEVNGMLVVPTEDGAVYVTREDAMSFFGLVEVPAEVEALREEIRIGNKLLKERYRLLAEIPGGINAHGDHCVQHAIDWVRAARARASHEGIQRLRSIIEVLECGRASEAQEMLAALVSDAERSAQDEPAPDHANSLYVVAYGERGDRVVSFSTTTTEPGREADVMTRFLELERAVRLRGVQFAGHVVGALEVRPAPACEPCGTPACPEHGIVQTDSHAPPVGVSGGADGG